MSKSAPQSPAGIPRSKLILIGVLGFVFLGVLVVQYRRLTHVEEVAVATSSPPATSKVGITGTTGTSGTSDKSVKTKTIAVAQWPVFPLTQVVTHDPFRFEQVTEVSANPQPTEMPILEHNALPVESTESTPIAQTPPTQVRQVVLGKNGARAKLDETWVEVGTELNGFRVIEIRADGVVIEPIASAE